MTDLKRALEIMAETFKDFSEISRKQYLNINDHYFLGKEDAYDLAIRYVENLIEIHFAKENGERVMKEYTGKLRFVERTADKKFVGTYFGKEIYTNKKIRILQQEVCEYDPTDLDTKNYYWVDVPLDAEL